MLRSKHSLELRYGVLSRRSPALNGSGTLDVRVWSSTLSLSSLPSMDVGREATTSCFNIYTYLVRSSSVCQTSLLSAFSSTLDVIRACATISHSAVPVKRDMTTSYVFSCPTHSSTLEAVLSRSQLPHSAVIFSRQQRRMDIAGSSAFYLRTDE